MQSKHTPKHIIDTFINNVESCDGELFVISTAKMLLGCPPEEKFPIANTKETFMDCMIAYLEYVEEYELCAKLIKNKKKVFNQLVPYDEYMTGVVKSMSQIIKDIKRF